LYKISVRGSHCGYWPWAPKNMDVPPCGHMWPSHGPIWRREEGASVDHNMVP